MRTYLFVLLQLAFLLPLSNVFSQEKAPVKFGKISPQDFDLSKQTFDTGASAVVIADVGVSSFDGNSKGWFSLIHKRQKRIKILNRNGFDAADVQVVLYSRGQAEEALENLKASTYNLENGKVVETKLESNAVFKEKISANVVRKKFTMPAVKVGSIIEFSYTLSSDFLFNLQPWVFQGDYPCLWSEYEVAMPDFFNYVVIMQGYNPFYINKKSNSFANFQIRDESTTNAGNVRFVSSTVTRTRWVIKDVPALREENFTSALNNYVSKVTFQLSQYRFPEMPVKNIMGNWVTATEEMMKEEEFGAPLTKGNGWLDDDLKVITRDSKNALEKAQKIFSFVRDNFTCTDFSDVFLNNSLKSIFKAKSGSVADINLLLVAMLKNEQLDADPLVLSTRSNGFANELYPLMNRFNYVIAGVNIDGQLYYLDASRPVGFGKLAPECYNGVARVISASPAAVYLEADSVNEKKLTSVILINNEKGQLIGTYQSALGYMESLQLRGQVKKGGEDDYFKKLKTASNLDLNITTGAIDSLKQLDVPVLVHYNFTMKNLDEDIIYFNPMFGEGYKENLFKAVERKYPVEMPYAFDETFVLNMEIPKNYVIEELPKSAKVSFNEGEGSFEYMIGKSGQDAIQVRSRVVLKKANFQPEDYNSLREFFGYIVKKHSEQIVLKKKS